MPRRYEDDRDNWMGAGRLVGARRTYTPKFRLSAVGLVESGYAIKDAAERLAIPTSTLHSWVRLSRVGSSRVEEAARPSPRGADDRLRARVQAMLAENIRTLLDADPEDLIGALLLVAGKRD